VCPTKITLGQLEDVQRADTELFEYPFKLSTERSISTISWDRSRQSFKLHQQTRQYVPDSGKDDPVCLSFMLVEPGVDYLPMYTFSKGASLMQQMYAYEGFTVESFAEDLIIMLSLD
jgi:hypothetical protein